MIRCRPCLPACSPDALRGTLSQPSTWKLELSRDNDLRYPGREGTPVPAAVLIPLVTREQGVSILLTQRAAHLYDHAGQISFPGGRIETSDPAGGRRAAPGARKPDCRPSMWKCWAACRRI